MRPAIVLSGQTAALGVVRSLGTMGVPVVLLHYDDQDFAHLSRYVTFSSRVPHPEKSEDQFIESLLDYGMRFPGAVLFPAADESVVAVARHKTHLARHFLVAATDWQVAQRFIDKQFTYVLAESCGVAIPRTIKARTLADALCGGREIGLPCLVKPCQSHLFHAHFGQKMVRTNTIEQLEKAYCAASEAGLEVMIQEFIPGEDSEVVNYNAYVWGGNFLAEFTSLHVRNAPPWFGSPRVVVSRKVPEVIEPGRRLLSELGYSGYACTEFKRDPRDGVYKLMEVNGRHNLSTMLAVRCGINFPWLHYRHLSDGVAPGPTDFRENVYWIDLVRDLGYSLMCRSQERYSLASYLRPYFTSHVFAILDCGDVRPFLRKVVSASAKFTRMLFRNESPSSLLHLKG